MQHTGGGEAAGGFELELPPSAHGPPSLLEGEGFDFAGFWRDTGGMPQQLFQMGAMQAVMAGREELDPLEVERNMERFSPAWSAMTTGFPSAVPVPAEVAAAACPEHGGPRGVVGRIVTSPDAGVDLELCACGWGFGIWRHEPPLEGPYLVAVLRPATPPGPDTVVAGYLRHPQHPLPAMGYVVHGGRLLGQLTCLRDRLLFAPGPSLALMGLRPQVAAEDLTAARAVLEAAREELAAELRAAVDAEAGL